MDDLPARFADTLESVAQKIRTMTVDRVARLIRVASLSLVVVTLGMLAAVFLFATAYGALAIPLGSFGAFAVLGGLFLIGAALVWSRRNRPPEDEP